MFEITTLLDIVNVFPVKSLSDFIVQTIEFCRISSLTVMKNIHLNVGFCPNQKGNKGELDLAEN